MADDSDPIGRLAARVSGNVRRPRVTKANRTLSLTDPLFTRIRNYCLWKDVPISEVVDELLVTFAERIGDEALDAAEAWVATQGPAALRRPPPGGRGGTGGGSDPE